MSFFIMYNYFKFRRGVEVLSIFDIVVF